MGIRIGISNLIIAGSRLKLIHHRDLIECGLDLSATLVSRGG